MRIEHAILKHLIYDEDYTRKVIPFIKAEYFSDRNERLIYEEINDFISSKINQYSFISNQICKSLDDLKKSRFNIDYQKQEGGIYISIYFEHVSYFGSVENFVEFLIKSCGVGMVPFEYFGSKENEGWFRMSIGGIDPNNIDNIKSVFKKICLNSISEINSWIV